MMVSIFYDEVVSLVDKLTPEERQALVEHVEENLTQKKLTPEEFARLLDSMVVDLGPIPPDWSDRREDWYGDDGR